MYNKITTYNYILGKRTVLKLRTGIQFKIRGHQEMTSQAGGGALDKEGQEAKGTSFPVQ